jgi:hypothetical protein
MQANPWTAWEFWKERLLPDGGGFYEIEGQRLFDLASAITADTWMVELGTYRGYSALCLLAGNGYRMAHIACVDMWGLAGYDVSWPRGNSEDLQTMLARAAEYNFLERLLPLRMGTVEAAEIWPANKKVALLHIDATHVHDTVLAEVAAWKKHLISGAVVCFHDYEPDFFPGVAQAVDELREQSEWRSFVLTKTLAELRYAP